MDSRAKFEKPERSSGRAGRVRAVGASPAVPPGLNKPYEAVLEFAKMQGLGNDFVVVSEADLKAAFARTKIGGDWRSQMSQIARALCNRHFGVGADGLIVAVPADIAGCDLGWVYLNGDGSTSDMCGNGLRCLALWAVDRKVAAGSEFSVATARGANPVEFKDRDSITIDLGEPMLKSVEIPVAGKPRDRVVREPLAVEERILTMTCVSMGNPHCVIINPPVDPADYLHLAPAIQSLASFPEGVNVEFALIDNPHSAKVFVWERGCGPTLACATGAAAVLVAGVLEGALARVAEIELPGGKLAVSWSEADNKVRLTGPAREMYRGTIDLASIMSESERR